MKDIETLQKIKAKEEESDLAISKAEKAQNEEVAKANKMAKEIIEKAESKAELEYKSILLNSDKKIQLQKDNMEGEHLEHISGIRKITKKHAMEIFESTIKKIFGV